jgi:hypothetical protein
MKDLDRPFEGEHSVAHFQAIASLSRALAQHGLWVIEHRYDESAFGSFTIILGRARLYLQFVWDGHGSYLTWEVGHFCRLPSTARWVPHGHDTFLNWVLSRFSKRTSPAAWVQHGDEPVEYPLAFKKIAEICEVELGVRLADAEQGA